jgi:hypothetical protein
VEQHLFRFSLHLNARNQAVKVRTVLVGMPDSSLVHPREVFKDGINASPGRLSGGVTFLEIESCISESGMNLARSPFGCPMHQPARVGRQAEAPSS